MLGFPKEIQDLLGRLSLISLVNLTIYIRKQPQFNNMKNQANLEKSSKSKLIFKNHNS
jgi:hypothetical protein